MLLSANKGVCTTVISGQALQNVGNGDKPSFLPLYRLLFFKPTKVGKVLVVNFLSSQVKSCDYDFRKILFQVLSNFWMICQLYIIEAKKFLKSLQKIVDTEHLTIYYTNNTYDEVIMNEINFYINDKHYTQRLEPGWTALYLLRNVLKLTGTKESCSEGDCGACTVAIGQYNNDNNFIYKSVNSCIFPAVKLHNTHLISIEGLSIDREIHPVQEFLLEHHGTQCGFCTPGIIMSLFALFSIKINPEKEDILSFLEGNLCRCTGYQTILDAAESLYSYYQKNPNAYECFMPSYCAEIQTELRKNKSSTTIASVSSAALERNETHKYLMPYTIEDFLNISNKNPQTKIINGGTDIMVEVNIKRQIPEELIDISKIAELQKTEFINNTLIIGGAVTYDDLSGNNEIIQKIPALKHIINQIASQQIRHTASISGNIANASPVADMATCLLALDTELTLILKDNQRTVKLKDFYLDYKKTILQQNELIKNIIIPVKKAFVNFEKSTKRKAVDISAVVSCCYIDDEIIRIAFGGVAAIPRVFEFKKEDDIVNKLLSEFSPLSDVRGSKEYRNILIKNHIQSHLQKFEGGINE